MEVDEDLPFDPECGVEVSSAAAPGMPDLVVDAAKRDSQRKGPAPTVQRRKSFARSMREKFKGFMHGSSKSLDRGTSEDGAGIPSLSSGTHEDRAGKMKHFFRSLSLSGGRQRDSFDGPKTSSPYNSLPRRSSLASLTAGFKMMTGAESRKLRRSETSQDDFRVIL